MPSSGPYGRPYVTEEGALVAYAEWMDAHMGVPPTVREFVDCLELGSSSAGDYWLKILTANGWLMHAVPERTSASGYRTNDRVLTEKGRALAEALMLRAVKRDLEAISA